MYIFFQLLTKIEINNHFNAYFFVVLHKLNLKNLLKKINYIILIIMQFYSF